MNNDNAKSAPAGQSRNEWQVINADQRRQAEEIYSLLGRFLAARERAEEALRDALALKGDTDDRGIQELAEAEATMASDQIDQLDMAALGLPTALEQLTARLRWIGQRRHSVRSLVIFQRVIEQKRKGLALDDIDGEWRRQCAIAAMPAPKKNPSESEIAHFFSVFKTAIATDRADEALETGNGPRKAAMEALARAHGTSRNALKRQFQRLSERRRTMLVPGSKVGILFTE